MIRVALVGTGNISVAHIGAYLKFTERCKIVAMVDIFPEKAVEKSEKYGIPCDIYEDYHDVLKRDDIDLVDICTPPYVHAQIAIDALLSGKNVVVEKPMAASLEECDKMLAAAEKSGKMLSSIAQNRFRNPIANLKAILDSNIAGDIKHAQVDSFWWRGHCYYDLWWRGLWSKEGGGCTLNHAVHQIDMLGWMMDVPQEVTAVMANVAHDNAEIEDLSVAIFKYPGALATVTSSVVHHGDTQGLTFQCADARVSAPFDTYASVSKPNGFPERNPALEAEIAALYDSLPVIEHEGHPGQIEDVLSALEENRAPKITGVDGRRTIELITAIYESGSTHKTVQLPIKKEDPFYTLQGMLDNTPRFYEKTTAVTSLSGENITLGSFENKK